MNPKETLLSGRSYTPSYSTDIRRTWAKFSDEWEQRMKGHVPPLPVTVVETHKRPK